MFLVVDGWLTLRQDYEELEPTVTALAARGLPMSALPPAAGPVIPFGIDEDALAPACADFAADPHFLVFGDTECGKSSLLRVLTSGICSAYDPDQAKVVFIDYRRSLLDSSEVPHQIGYGTSSVAAASLLGDVRQALMKRLPPPDLTPGQLRARSWWSGPDLFLIVDDYDLVAGSANPMLALSELLPQARDIGLHVVLARSAGGAGRAMFDPVIQRLREMGSPGLIMAGNRDEGQLLGGVRPAPQPPGRGFLVERRTGGRLVQAALPGELAEARLPGPAGTADTAGAVGAAGAAGRP